MHQEQFYNNAVLLTKNFQVPADDGLNFSSQEYISSEVLWPQQIQTVMQICYNVGIIERQQMGYNNLEQTWTQSSFLCLTLSRVLWLQKKSFLKQQALRTPFIIQILPSS
jgi:hypothetical protein